MKTKRFHASAESEAMNAAPDIDRRRLIKVKGRRLAAAPHNAGVNRITPRPLDHYFVNQTAQQGFTLRLRQHVRGPEFGQLLPHGTESRLKRGRERLFGRR
jgi:hypothetical protein